MENVGITKLYHDHATRIIRMHQRAGAPANISRAAIEEAILLELEKAVLPAPLKIAWFAAILGGDHFAPFWVKTLERIPLTEGQMEKYEPDEALYDHNLPPPRARLFLRPPAPQAAPAAPQAAPPAPQAALAAPQVAPPAAAAAAATPMPRRNPSRRARPGQHPPSILRRRPQGQPSPRRPPRSVAFAPNATVHTFR